jgi:hypothetical protein
MVEKRRLDGESGFEVGFEFAVVSRLRTGGGAGGFFAAGVGEVFAYDLTQTRCDVGPSTHIFGFFLAPDELRGVMEFADEKGRKLVMEGVELLDADDGGVLYVVLFAKGIEIVKNFAGAENDALEGGGVLVGKRIGKNFLEAGAWEEVLDAGDSFGAGK